MLFDAPLALRKKKKPFKHNEQIYSVCLNASMWSVSFIFQKRTNKYQDSPPVGNRKRRITRSITCPSVICPGGYPILTLLGRYPTLTWLGTTPSCPGWGVHLSCSWPGGYPILSCHGVPPHPPRNGGPGTSHWGTPMERT